MRGGRLRTRFDVQSATSTRNDHGEAVLSWSNVGQAWGRVEHEGGGESSVGEQVKGTQATRITLRYYSGLTTLHRLRADGVVYEIVSIANVEHRNREMLLQCKSAN